MPVNHRKKVIFVHIPKCAGTSIEKLFGMATREDLFTICPWDHKTITNEFLFDERWKFESCAAKNMQHYTFKEISAVLGSEIVSSYDIFSVVRNPYTRIVSDYEYCKAGRSRLGSLFPCETFVDFVNTQLDLPQFERIKNYDGHLETQSSYLQNDQNDLKSIDTIYRFEEMENVIKDLTIKYSLPNIKIHARGGSYSKNYSEYYSSDEIINKVKTFYAIDFDLFNYDPNRVPS